jgi:uncharacterized protein
MSVSAIVLRMSMRFLVISDIHSREKAIYWTNAKGKELEVDGVLVLGDITHFGPPEWAGEFFERLEFPAYAIPGNCDPPNTLRWIERTATSLHRKKIKIAGQTFIGLGGSNPTIYDTPNELSEEEIMGLIGPLMEKAAILVVHTPPRGINDTTHDGRQVGSTAMKELVERFPPKVYLSGHIHEARGIVERGGSKFMNPGPAKEGYMGLLELGERTEVRLLDRMV